jgi:GGDEF domain-containing protein
MKLSKKWALNYLTFSRKGENGKLLDKANFAGHLRYERERSERTNHPFSLICIDLSKIKECSNGHGFEEVLDIITASIRAIDRVGWIQKNLIGIILPDTPKGGAVNLAEKLRDRLMQGLNNNGLPQSFIVSTYPELARYCYDTNTRETQTHDFKTKIS